MQALIVELVYFKAIIIHIEEYADRELDAARSWTRDQRGSTAERHDSISRFSTPLQQ